MGGQEAVLAGRGVFQIVSCSVVWLRRTEDVETVQVSREMSLLPPLLWAGLPQVVDAVPGACPWRESHSALCQGSRMAPALLGTPACARRKGWSPAGKGGGLLSDEALAFLTWLKLKPSHGLAGCQKRSISGRLVLLKLAV